MREYVDTVWGWDVNRRAQELYLREGFSVVSETETHVRMRH